MLKSGKYIFPKEAEGAELKVYDLYELEAYTGCVSCFGCKLPGSLGVCAHKDGLTPLLEEIRHADGLILGTPNYLGEVSAQFRALFERLIFQTLSYKLSPRNYTSRPIPVLFIMTSNSPEEFYPQIGYDRVLERYQGSLSAMVGPTKVFICGDTLQVKNYAPFDWTFFDAEAKKARHESVFPSEKEKVFSLGAKLSRGDW